MPKLPLLLQYPALVAGCKVTPETLSRLRWLYALSPFSSRSYPRVPHTSGSGGSLFLTTSPVPTDRGSSGEDRCPVAVRDSYLSPVVVLGGEE